jgi:hypothetical protein
MPKCWNVSCFSLWDFTFHETRMQVMKLLLRTFGHRNTKMPKWFGTCSLEPLVIERLKFRNGLTLAPSRFCGSQNQDARGILTPWGLRSLKYRNDEVLKCWNALAFNQRLTITSVIDDSCWIVILQFGYSGFWGTRDCLSTFRYPKSRNEPTVLIVWWLMALIKLRFCDFTIRGSKGHNLYLSTLWYPKSWNEPMV